MNLFKNIFGNKKSADLAKTKKLKSERTGSIPVEKSSWYLTHNEFVSKEFNFLITDFGFKILKKEFVGREFWTVYAKEDINVEIWSDAGELPYVFIRNTELPYDESKGLDNRDNIDDFNLTAKQIRQLWTKRRKPIQQKFMNEWLKKDNLDLSALNKDYENFGKQQHKKYLSEAALTVREHIELKKGKLKIHPNA